MIIIVDCGTTNMRCRLLDGETFVDAERTVCGCRDRAFTGSSDILEETLSGLIRTLLERNSLTEKDVEIILSTGTLASDVGIHPIPHALCPAGITESARASSLAVKERVSGIPILFIPGVKTLPDGDAPLEESILAYESMSGEECEIYGIASALPLPDEFVITLPGSYNKVMEIRDGKIQSIRTGLCGELIAAISEHTLLKSALPSPVIRTLCPEMLRLGYRMAQKYGSSPMLVKARTLQLFGGYTQDEAACFFVGALLHGDIASVAQVAKKPEWAGKPVVIGGSDPLRTVFALLLEEAGVTGLVTVPDGVATSATSRGAMKVYKEWQRLNATADRK